MTTPTRYRGQPVSEGIGTGGIYLGDAPGEADRGQPDPGEDDVRAAFAAVAQERAALAGRLRERGQDLEAGIVDIGALIAADSALVGPAVDAVRLAPVRFAGSVAEVDPPGCLLYTSPSPRDS